VNKAYRLCAGKNIKNTTISSTTRYVRNMSIG